MPVVHTGGTFRHPIGEIAVDWSRDWLTRHKRAIDSAYMSSAYFEHYRDALYSVLDRKPETLWDLDLSVINFFLKICGRPCAGETAPDGNIPVGFTTEYSGVRCDIHPKHPDPVWVGMSSDASNILGRPYFQVFSSRFGFVPNLSIADYVFNEGPVVRF